MSNRSRSIPGLCCASTILLGAFLVFQVQPVISKFILPWFGGTPAVWTTCMLFFQVVLFAGYAYAHWSIRRLSPARQGLTHLLLIFVALALLPIVPGDAWKPHDPSRPILNILGLLAATVGFPYFVLSATGPLVQAWFSRASGGSSPYRLYALSNAGSLAALVSYPFVVEPALATTAQARLWSIGFAGFALLCGYLALRIWQAGHGSTDRFAEPRAANPMSGVSVPPTWRQRWTWLALAACASVMLLATTNHVCQDVAVIPFLWVVPLSLYLITFIVCFEYERWYSRRWFGCAAAASTLAASALFLVGSAAHLLVELGVYLAAMFFACMVCHGELIRRKPAAEHLTSFYLMGAAGGALGGLLVAVAAPLLFSTYLEFKWCLLACYVLAVAVAAVDLRQTWLQGRPRLARGAALLALLGLIAVVRCQTSSHLARALHCTRSFYGVLYVDDVDANAPAKHGHALRCGRILHGFQYLSDARRRTPTLYYDPQSGIGLAVRHFPSPSRRIGLVGLGVGTLAAYGSPRDYLRFYEINPDVLRVAHTYFSYLRDCPSQVDVVLGDARLSLEREPPQRFDILALDAFSGDAIPAHLLTREAFDVYRRHLSPGGVLAVHITNRHVDLHPVLRGLAEHDGYEMLCIDTRNRLDAAATASTWVLLSHNRQFLATKALRRAANPSLRQFAQVPLWTDDYSNLFQILR